jgi:hypothetical protein
MTVLNYLPTPSHSDREVSIRGNWFSWAVFLGISWTWCIGMFLPVLLMRDFGGWGWIAFAVPNVVGAAAMGFAIRDATTSAAITRMHGRACAWFSLITIAFHVFFVGWLNRLYPGFAVLAAFAAALVYAVGRLRGALDRTSTGVAALISLGCLAMFVLQRSYDAPKMHVPVAVVGDLLPLVPVMCFGFLLCPYLDLTFHRARMSTTQPAARLAFAVGFAVVFLTMILFSMLYATNIAVSRFVTMLSHEPTRDLLLDAVAIHIAVQCGLTAALHARALIELHKVTRVPGIGATVLVIAVAVTLGIAANRPSLTRPLAVFSTGELIYRCFMGFYGLVFPAYVWLCMIPGRGRVAPKRGQWIVWAIAVLMAAPIFWMGFVQAKMVWLLPGVGVVLLARVFVPRTDVPPAALGAGGGNRNVARDH